MSYQSMRRGGSLILYVSSGSFEIEREAIGLETGYVGLMLGVFFKPFALIMSTHSTH